MNTYRPFMAVLAILVLTGCGKKPVPEPVTPAPTTPAAQSDADRDAEAARRRAEEEARRRAEEEANRTRATLQEMIFFDYDQSALRTDARAVLDAKLPILRQDPTLTLRIEGHADDRGSTEYNLALGARRAQAIKDYLVGFGIGDGRLDVISFGEERPLVTGSGETSWARNRRGEFVVGDRTTAARPGR